MIGWFLVSGGLFYFAFLSATHSSRRMGLMLLCAWMLFTLGMLVLGVDPALRD